jgi:hypothetical protein
MYIYPYVNVIHAQFVVISLVLLAEKKKRIEHINSLKKIMKSVFACMVTSKYTENNIKKNNELDA